MRKYKLKRGLPVSADIVAKEINALMKSNKGIISPNQLVNSAKKKKSPIHDCFTWDDTKAAKKYRIEEAKYLLRTVIVEYIQENKTYTTRAFVSTNDKEYQKIESVLADDELVEHLLEQAKKDFLAYKSKYQHLEKLQILWETFEDIFD